MSEKLSTDNYLRIWLIREEERGLLTEECEIEEGCYFFIVVFVLLYCLSLSMSKG